MKKWMLSISVVALFLSGCVQQQSSSEEEVVQEDASSQEETSIVPSNRLSGKITE